MATVTNQKMAEIIIAIKGKIDNVIAQNAVNLATNEYVANMKNRIFKDGKNTKDQQIGEYKKDGRHKVYRESRGRQTGYVDFKIDGSLQLAVQSDKNNVGFTSVKEYIKAKGLQYGNGRGLIGFGEVFQPTENEKEKHTENTQNYYFSELKKING